MADNEMEIPIRPGLVIPRREIWFEFSHASGPGGQNVNKVETAATLCFHPASASTLSPVQKHLVETKLANRINADGILKITASDSRSQSGNRAMAEMRFRELLADILRPVKKRRPTKPTYASRQKRLTDKRVQSLRKANRTFKPDELE